jgi:dihydrofolate reductase
MQITVVAAHARNYVIGDKGQIPWMGQFPEDMKHFRQLTEGPGKAVLMGRKTYESLPGPLRNRVNIVMTRQKTYPLDPYIVRVDNHAQAIRWAERNKIQKLFVIGGAEIYKEALTYADDIWVTTIDADYPGDAKFPLINQDEFHVSMTQSMQGEKLGTTFQFQYWLRNHGVRSRDAQAA